MWDFENISYPSKLDILLEIFGKSLYVIENGYFYDYFEGPSHPSKIFKVQILSHFNVVLGGLSVGTFSKSSVGFWEYFEDYFKGNVKIPQSHSNVKLQGYFEDLSKWDDFEDFSKMHRSGTFMLFKLIIHSILRTFGNTFQITFGWFF